MATALKRRLEQLTSRTEREIAALWRRSREGVIDQDTFVEIAVLLLARSRAQGVVIADLAVSAAVARALDVDVDPIGLSTPDNDADRLVTSIRSVLTEDIKGATTPEERDRSRGLRLERLSRDSVPDALTWAMGLAMATHAKATERRIGWIRATDIDPCRICRNLADGVVRPPEVRMKRHNGCDCVPQVVIGGMAA